MEIDRKCIRGGISSDNESWDADHEDDDVSTKILQVLENLKQTAFLNGRPTRIIVFKACRHTTWTHFIVRATVP